MQKNKITVRFNDIELDKIKKVAEEKDMKVATLIRTATLNVITNKEFLNDKEEMIKVISEIVEQNNDKKLGRIISLIFRATSHVDVVKEQINVLFQVIQNTGDEDKDYSELLYKNHKITRLAEEKMKKQDIYNINRKKYGGMNEFD